MILPPKQLLLSDYRELIKNLPYLEHAFETKEDNWFYEKQLHNNFARFCELVFIDGKLKLSRSDLFAFANRDFDQAVISIIFWGYPRNMRGRTFNEILKALPKLKKALNKEKSLSKLDFDVLCKETKNTGVGLSTLTKFLYFLDYTLEGCKCLILDARIIDVLNEGQFSDLPALGKIHYGNKWAKYKAYLEVMYEKSKAEGYLPDQLELFLFQFGKNLKKK